MKKYHKTLQKDAQIAPLLMQFSDIDELAIVEDLFIEVVSTIVGQQLSVKAAETIWSRFEKLFENAQITPKSVLEVSDEEIRAAGISFSKIKYIKGFAQMVLNEEIVLSDLRNLSDEEVIAVLTKAKGIGKWTAEMLLMFALAREDVFSLGDLGLRTAVSQLYKVDRDDLAAIENIANTWKPYRTYAARLLWKSLDNKPKDAPGQ